MTAMMNYWNNADCVSCSSMIVNDKFIVTASGFWIISSAHLTLRLKKSWNLKAWGRVITKTNKYSQAYKKLFWNTGRPKKVVYTHIKKNKAKKAMKIISIFKNKLCLYNSQKKDLINLFYLIKLIYC